MQYTDWTNISSFVFFNPCALRTDKTLWSFGSSECKRVKKGYLYLIGPKYAIHNFSILSLEGNRACIEVQGNESI